MQLIPFRAAQALPVFLDRLMPSWAAVLLSVTVVLICGEILPSAVFTGPNQPLGRGRPLTPEHVRRLPFGQADLPKQAQHRESQSTTGLARGWVQTGPLNIMSLCFVSTMFFKQHHVFVLHLLQTAPQSASLALGLLSPALWCRWCSCWSSCFSAWLSPSQMSWIKCSRPAGAKT